MQHMKKYVGFLVGGSEKTKCSRSITKPERWPKSVTSTTETNSQTIFCNNANKQTHKQKKKEKKRKDVMQTEPFCVEMA